jgi:curved DNA-binding protein CbpA
MEELFKAVIDVCRAYLGEKSLFKKKPKNEETMARNLLRLARNLSDPFAEMEGRHQAMSREEAMFTELTNAIEALGARSGLAIRLKPIKQLYVDKQRRREEAVIIQEEEEAQDKGPRIFSFYDVVGVLSDASSAIITAAYEKKLSFIRLPENRGNLEEAREKTEELNEAYKTLINPARRRVYDLSWKGKEASESRSFTLYDVVGILSSASPRTIKQAYRAKSLCVHPDKNPSNSKEAARKSAELSHAYTILKDPAQRANYDQILQKQAGVSVRPIAEPRSARSDSAVASSSSDIHLAFKIPYRDLSLGRPLGEGAGGKVFEGMCHNIGKVAIKQIEDAGGLQILRGISARQAFMQEAQMMGRLQHPNLARLWGVSGGEEEGHHYSMVMEYMSKGSLFDVIQRRERLSWRQRWQIAVDVGQGLAFLHGRHTLHHDLKSPNVLLDEDMQAKLTDFGLSVIRLSPGKLPPHIASQTLCDNRWKAPELFERGARYTQKADVFSYGVILWELATGKEPIGGKPREKDIPATCPGEFKAIIKRCRKTKPEKRCTIQEAVADLNKHQAAICRR